MSDIYLVGFHPLKDDPAHQFEAHHFCRPVNEDFMQCTLYDGNTPDANLNGIEYIISEPLFERLPEHERQYWHPPQRGDPVEAARGARAAGGGRKGADAGQDEQLRQDLAYVEHPAQRRRRPPR